MTIARIPSSHPKSSQLPSLSATKPVAYDNSQPCAAPPVRAIEDSTVYTATRGQVSMAGSCRKTNFNTADSPAVFRIRSAIEPYTAEANIWFGVSSDTAGNTVAIGGETFTVPKAQSIADFSQHMRIVKNVTVGSGDKSDLGTDDELITVTISSGLMRVWYVMIEPVPLAPGNVTVS